MSCPECSSTVDSQYPCNCNNDCPSQSTPGATGSTGAPGNNGVDGTNGVNAYTNLTSAFTTPAVNANTTAQVGNSTWATVLQVVFMGNGGGFFQVTAKPDATHITLKNLGTALNAAPFTIIASGSQLSPAGYEGPALTNPLPVGQGGTGQTSKIAAMNALSPLSTSGDTFVFEAGSNIRKPIGTTNQIPVSNGTTWNWSLNRPVGTNITGQVPITAGGTGASTGTGARTNLAVPGLLTDNTLKGNNAFWVPVGGAFTVTDDSGLVAYLKIDRSDGTVALKDTTGTQALDAGSRLLVGQWAQPRAAYTVASGATYTVGASVERVVSTRSATGIQTITLPAGTDGRIIRISDFGGNASANAITIAAAGSDTIVGASTYTLNLNWGAISLMYYATSTTWGIIS